MSPYDDIRTDRSLLNRLSSIPESNDAALNREWNRAWNQFVQIYEPVLHKMGVKSGLREDEAQDMCQNVFAKVSKLSWQFRHTDEFGFYLEAQTPEICNVGTAEKRRFLHWIKAVAKRTFYETLRRRRDKEIVPSQLTDDGNQVDDYLEQFPETRSLSPDREVLKDERLAELRSSLKWALRGFANACRTPKQKAGLRVFLEVQMADNKDEAELSRQLSMSRNNWKRYALDKSFERAKLRFQEALGRQGLGNLDEGVIREILQQTPSLVSSIEDSISRPEDFDCQDTLAQQLHSSDGGTIFSSASYTSDQRQRIQTIHLFNERLKGNWPTAASLAYFERDKSVPAILPIGDQLIVGRRPGPDVTAVNSPYMSRQHFQIVRAGNSFFLSDLGSTTGTLVNGEPWNERISKLSRRRLVNGQLIEAGGVVFLFHCESPAVSGPEESL